MRLAFTLALALQSLGFAQQITLVTSAASAAAGLAPEAFATVMGTGLAMRTGKADATPWPVTLGGAAVTVTDSAGTSRMAGLLFVSPAQINFQIPAGTATGPATIAVNNGSGTASAKVQVQAVAPALFAVNAQGIAAATGIRVVIPTQFQAPVPVFQCTGTPPTCELVPINVGVDAPVYLSFYGTGIRGRSGLANVKVTIGTTSVPVLYAGPQPDFPGLDQVNVPLVLSLRGAGVVNVTVTVDGVTSNAVRIQVM